MSTDISTSRADDQHEHPWQSTLVRVAVCWMIGIVLSDTLGGHVWWWLGAVAVVCVVVLIMAGLRRSRGVRTWACVAIVLLGAAWTVVRVHHIPGDHILRFVGETSQLARVVGVVEGDSHITSPHRGAFGQFTYKTPGTLFVLRVERIVVDGWLQPACGRVLGKVQQADHRVRDGMRIEATGWLAALDGPANPGERDYRAVMKRNGVDGRLTMRSRGNWRLINPPPAVKRIGLSRARFADAAQWSLRLGLDDGPQRVAFLEKILLGRRGAPLDEVTEQFRKVGLAHLLSISGAHLGMLLLVVWAAVRLALPHPAWSAVAVLIVLVLFMCVVPWRVPIVRAATMAALFCVVQLTGRPLAPLAVMALAATIILIWLPTDLFEPGFQLSFGVVTALVLWTRPMSDGIFPPTFESGHELRAATAVGRWGASFLAANVVAFIVALPLVAYHFRFISPLTIVLTMLAFPVVTALLTLGYFKIIVGVLFPSAGMALSGPLAWLTDTLLGLVGHAQTWRGSYVELAGQPSVWWTIGALALACATFSGLFRRRRIVLCVTWAMCFVWLPTIGMSPLDKFARGATDDASPIIARLNMFAVGNGSCYLLRTYDIRRDEPATVQRTIMFDCGSQSYWDLGESVIVPALKYLGVTRIDAMFLSHADIDHYGGSLDVIAKVPVDRVYVPPQMLTEAQSHPDRAPAFLIAQLKAHGVPVTAVVRGWSQQWANCGATMIWPPPDLPGVRANDTSLVMKVRAGEHRILFTGDVQGYAMSALLDADADVRAHVCELPHHGSFVNAAPLFLHRAAPRFVLQSSARDRLYHDRWADHFRNDAAQRLITANLGMVELRFHADGTITWSSFRNTATCPVNRAAPVAGTPPQ